MEIADSTVTTQKPAQLTRAQVAPIHDFLHASQIGWIECETNAQAEALKAYALQTLNPFLNKQK